MYKYAPPHAIKREVEIIRALHYEGMKGIVTLLHTCDVSDTVSVMITPIAYCDAFQLVKDYDVSRKTKNVFMKFLVHAVAFLHNMDLYYGDCRLEHILVYGDENFKLCDFKNVGVTHDVTRDAYSKPSPYYAPEVYSGQVDMFAQDIWATGMTIFLFWCKLKPPFLAANEEVDRMLTTLYNTENGECRLSCARNFFEIGASYITHSFCKFSECEALKQSMMVSNMIARVENRYKFRVGK